jgi:hypothetical protein
MPATLRRGLSWQIENYVDLILSVDQKQWTHISICQLDPLCGLAADIIFNLPTQSSLWIRAADVIFNLPTQSSADQSSRHNFLSANSILSADQSSGHNFHVRRPDTLRRFEWWTQCSTHSPLQISAADTIFPLWTQSSL